MKLTLRLWILIFFLAISLLAIFGFPPAFLENGVVITSVTQNSTAFEQGLRQGQIIVAIDGKTISTLEDYSNSFQGKYSSGENVKTIIQTKDLEIILFSNSAPEITVKDIPKTKIQMGLDLAGGSKALIQAEDKKLTLSEATDLVDVLNNRLNVYGITDMRILPVLDLDGNNRVLIEIAGATPDDLEELISKQGRFEAKIGEEIVFVGGEKDIVSVCRNDATCAGIETPQKNGEVYYANFRFTIYLSEESAKRHADITGELGINISNPEYLDKKLDLYVDDNLLSSLFIGKGLQGRETSQIQISGSGSGLTQEEAYDNANEEMHNLQTILITGSLPFKLEIVKLDTISPVLGKEFLRSIFLAGLVALLAVAIIIFFRYKKLKSSLALLVTSVSEIFIILGIASIINWNLDLPSIAGIIATIGTGIDSQIIILDEATQNISLSMKQRLKRAFTIILGAYFTVLVAMIPLMWAGAGLLKGFAITTIIGVTIGVFITRPAFSDMIQKIEE